MAASGMA